MNEQNPVSGRGSGKRGRPPVGKPEQVRLSEAEKTLAIRLGDGVLAKGIRNALQMADRSPETAAQTSLLLFLTELIADGKPDEQLTLDDLRERLVSLKAAEAVLMSPDQKAPHLSPQDLVTATELGDGSVTRGVAIALSAARFLGSETARKLNHHGSGHTR